VSESDDEPVPKLPRGRGFKLSGPELFRIFITLISLIGVIVLAKPCASSVSNFVTGYDQGSDTSKLPKPGNVEPTTTPSDIDQYERLRPDMTEAEMKAAMERAKAKSHAGSASSAGGAP